MANIVKLPGFIDIHVHLRDPGALQKEDFATGTTAAAAGGAIFVIDMPNNLIPTFSVAALAQKKQLVLQKAIIPVGFHYGTNGRNMNSFKDAWDNAQIFGLKVYCNHTTGDYLIDDIQKLEDIFRAWDCDKPILVHAEGEQLTAAMKLAKTYRRKLHICHISQISEVDAVQKAKQQGLLVSAGVTPHHLYMTDEDHTRYGAYASMKPPLGTKADQDALWKGLRDGTIDVIETDHAPHTKEEKESGNPPFGVPGLETALALLLTSYNEGDISIEDIVRWTHGNPKKLFGVPTSPDTYITVDLDTEWNAQDVQLKTKCGWSPFHQKLKGKTIQTVIAGSVVYDGI